jgi:APA family basic amino acid/polyamine antiporter
MSEPPRRQLGVRHAMSMCVGMVIGAGIFRSAPNVAESIAGLDLGPLHLSGANELFLLWVVGGVLSLLGALCFAEMAAAFPHAGGDYFFLSRAYGKRVALLFAWSRFSVIHTGSMAMLAILFGDYLKQVVDLGPYTSMAFGLLVIVVLVALNLRGIRVGLGTQVGFMGVVLFGLACVGLGGAWQAIEGVAPLTAMAGPADIGAAGAGRAGLGQALVFILLAYGGWSDAATLSSDMKDERRGIVYALMGGMSVIAALYLCANWGYLRVLGFDGLANSRAPAADLMRAAFGRPGELLIVTTVAMTSISVMNAILIAGSRTTWAAARDITGVDALGAWDGQRGTPPGALLAMGGVALALVTLTSITEVAFQDAGGSPFAKIVEYLTPVFWVFLSLSALAVIVLRVREPGVPRPFRVPGYPVTPILFSASCLYMVYTTLEYTIRTGKAWALASVVVLALGAVLLLPRRKK